MGVKKSLMLADATVRYMQDRTRDGEDILWSQMVNDGFKQLSWLTRQALPNLHTADWELLLNVYAGSWLEFQPPFRVASDVMDHFGVVDINALDPEVRLQVVRLHGLTQVEQYAVMEFVRIFWTHDWNVEPDFETIMSKISKML